MREDTVNNPARTGYLTIPLVDQSGDPLKVGWIVDGQQRAAAIREAKVQSFPVFVTGFVVDSEEEQREQFILVNSPKPLPRDLIYELLPGTVSRLPSLLQRRRFSASLLARLNHDEDSPLRELIRTPTNPKGVIKDNSILRMIEHSLSDGALYVYRRSGTEQTDTEGMLVLLKAFWKATSKVFPDAWGLSPRVSRLMHGAGIIGMGLVMDAIADEYEQGEEISYETFRAKLISLREDCHWTAGYWIFSDGRERKWNEVQNTPKDVQMLAMHLLTKYQERTANYP